MVKDDGNNLLCCIKNRRGGSTAELLLITAALVSVAIVFKDSLVDFTERAANAAFVEPPKVERMTFGGEE